MRSPCQCSGGGQDHIDEFPNLIRHRARRELRNQCSGHAWRHITTAAPAVMSRLDQPVVHCSGYESDLERDELHWKQQQSAEALSQIQEMNRPCEAGEGDQDTFMHDNAWMDRYRKGVVSRYAPHVGRSYDLCFCTL